MPITQAFQYFKPTDVAEAVALLSKFERAEVLAGGTDMVNILKEQGKCSNPSACLTTLEAVVDIKGIDSLREVSEQDGRLRLGALVTFTEIIASDLVRARMPVLAEVALTVGSVGVRNRATMAGNICSAVPCMDSGPPMRAFDAEIVIEGPEGRRVVNAADFFVSPRRTALRKGEILTRIDFPIPSSGHGASFVKMRRYEGEDLAQASVLMVALPDNQYRVTFGSVAPVPIRSPRMEQLMAGYPLTDALIAKAKEFIPEEITPITDVRATREYRMHMVRIMFERGARAAVARLDGRGPAYGEHLV